MKFHRVIGALLAVLACVALAGAALASKGSKPAPTPHHMTRSYANESQGLAEQESGEQGEPAQGHEDPPGQDVNHECTGDCQE